MKKIAILITFIFMGVSAFAQNTDSTQLLKYVTNSPDGTALVTVYDNLNNDNLKLQSANNFYKYQILDIDTLEVLYELDNKGKECTIDKTKFVSGSYNLRLFTSKLIITSKIEISNLNNL
jgi:hypothetical protein